MAVGSAHGPARTQPGSGNPGLKQRSLEGTQGGGEERGRAPDSSGRSEEAVRQAKAAPYRQHLAPLLPRWF